MAAPTVITLEPPILNSHSPAELSLTANLIPQPAGDSSPDSLHTPTEECGNISTDMSHAGPIFQCTQQPDAAQVSTDLIFETWATELVNDSDKEFILSGVRESFHLLPVDVTVIPAFTKNNQSVLKPGAKDQIEAQIEKGLLDGHFALADKSNTPIIFNALGAVPKKDSKELRMIMGCSHPLNTSTNSYMDLEHYKYVTVDDAATQASPGCWLAKVDLKHAYRSVGINYRNVSDYISLPNRIPRNGKVEVRIKPKQQSKLLSLKNIPFRCTLESWKEQIRQKQKINPKSYCYAESSLGCFDVEGIKGMLQITKALDIKRAVEKELDWFASTFPCPHSVMSYPATNSITKFQTLLFREN
ncbi:amiloride-sensitive sodium channel [Desmophyllum pertusum]|uniref:Amiloride-sensitive sodium channel n=1 Tax=Desmophyllum pertusum TaxID=174260 RepID=A0A9X0DDA9_9CNID|nr:amiloride-sensitive sodium channel [Desmophyllum pertusum]